MTGTIFFSLQDEDVTSTVYEDRIQIVNVVSIGKTADCDTEQVNQVLSIVDHD